MNTDRNQVAATIWSGAMEDLKTFEEAEQIALAIIDYLTAKRNNQPVRIEVVNKCSAPCVMNYCNKSENTAAMREHRDYKKNLFKKDGKS